MKSVKQLREDAEQEYYEKDSRAHRWGVISHSMRQMYEMLMRFRRDYCNCQRCGHSRYAADYLRRYREYPPEYERECLRCREEGQLLKELICEMSELESKTQEVCTRYDEARVSRPLHLP